MPDVSPSEYLNSLLVAYQYADKVYGQSVTDVVTAEIRRDEALNAKNEAFQRLEEARSRFKKGGGGGGVPTTISHGITTDTTITTQPPQPPQPPQPKTRPPPSPQVFKTPPPEQRESVTSKIGGWPPSTTELPLSPSKVVRASSSSPPPPPRQEVAAPSPRRSSHTMPRAAGAASPRVSPRKITRNSVAAIPQSPGRPRSSRIMRAIEFGKVDPGLPLLEISKGRTPEWLEEHLDSDTLGLVKRFSQASFGTKTFEKTKKVKVYTILLNDEWTELVTTTEQIQEVYVGSNTNPNSKPTLRDRAAEALVSPLPKDPIAVFLAPKNATGTSNIYYAGHWGVLDGKMLTPPRMVKGQMRQALIKLEFHGVDKAIVDAINKEYA